MTLLNIRRAAS